MKLLLSVIFLFFVYSLAFSQNSPQSLFIYKAQDRRDILLPLIDANGNLTNVTTGPKKTGPARMKLEAIIYSPGQESVAVISGDVYRVNEFVGEYKIIKIEENKVVLERKGKTYGMILEEEEK